MTIKLTEEENNNLKELYKRAKEMPVITMSIEEGMKHGSWADQAWEDVRKYMDELGKKYGYDPSKYAVKPDGEVVPHG